MFKVLLLKEFKNFIYSYQCWGCFVILSFVELILLKVSNLQINIWIYLWITSIGISQYVYDSYITDVKEKGLLFLFNIKTTFEKSFYAKMIFAFILGMILLSLNFDLFLDSLKIYELLWILLFYVFSALSMFIISVLTENSEIGGMLLSSGVCAFILFIIYKLKNIFLQVSLILLFIGLFLLISKKLYNAIIFRQQI